MITKPSKTKARKKKKRSGKLKRKKVLPPLRLRHDEPEAHLRALLPEHPRRQHSRQNTRGRRARRIPNTAAQHQLPQSHQQPARVPLPARSTESTPTSSTTRTPTPIAQQSEPEQTKSRQGPQHISTTPAPAKPPTTYTGPATTGRKNPQRYPQRLAPQCPATTTTLQKQHDKASSGDACRSKQGRFPDTRAAPIAVQEHMRGPWNTLQTRTWTTWKPSRGHR